MVQRSTHTLTVVALLVVASCRPPITAVARRPTARDAALLDHPHVRLVFAPPVDGASALQLAKLERGRRLAEHAINDPSFRERVFQFSSEPYGGGPGDGFLQAERAQPHLHPIASNAEVLEALLRVDAALIQLPIRVTKRGTSLSGFAKTPFQVPGGITSISPDWLDRPWVTDSMVAENLIHEHMHRLGFEHEPGFSIRRCGSVPYAVGQLVCAVAAGDAACLPARGARC